MNRIFLEYSYFYNKHGIISTKMMNILITSVGVPIWYATVGTLFLAPKLIHFILHYFFNKIIINYDDLSRIRLAAVM